MRLEAMRHPNINEFSDQSMRMARREMRKHLLCLLLAGNLVFFAGNAMADTTRDAVLAWGEGDACRRVGRPQQSPLCP